MKPIAVAVARILRSATFVTFLALLAFTGVMPPAAARAQTITDGLVGLLNTQTLQPGDVVKDQGAALTTTQTVARALSIELATIPVTSSAGGFVYRFNRSLAVVERASDSFGPFFAERALRPGRHQTSIGWTLRYAEYTKLDGYRLDEGTFVTSANVRVGERRPFSIDRLSLRMTTRQITGFGNYGITDRVDVGIAVPVVTLRVQGQRTNAVNGGIPVVQAAVSGETTGLGDVALRGRAHLVGDGRTGLGVGADVRLPTGREEDLLGAGKTALKMFGIGSFEGGRFAAHVNAGGTVGGLGRELNYNAASTFAIAQHVTLVGEVLGRRVTNLAKVVPVYEPHPLVPDVTTMRWMPEGTATNMVLLLAGFKVNVAQGWLLNANVTFRPTQGGLSGRVVPGVALDYSFGS
jgi:hypothetical protein